MASVNKPLGWWRLLRPLLFHLDPELAHQLALSVAAGWSHLLANLSPPQRTPNLALLGLEFANPLGLAAGLDKDAVAVPLWQQLGFGFVEVGTVTALPQPGNPRPRLFRLPKDEALINRMGFNNAGAEAMAVQLARWRAKGALQVPIGVNIGKNKSVSMAKAPQNYQHSFERLGALADYVVVNISSPNTPGLRDLQTLDSIQRIIDAIQIPNQRLSQPRPLLVKLAPDLDDQALIDCAQAALAAGCAGLILTNTTLDFSGLITQVSGYSGGLSGRPLAARSTAALAAVRQAIGPEPVLIGVGGILTAADAQSKLAAGADLLQLYTGLIYRGPQLVRDLLQQLSS